MKTLHLLTLLIAFSATGASAQSAQMMSQPCTDDKTGGLEKLQATMADMQQNIRALCKAGKRDEAQAYSLQRGKEIENDPYLKQVQNCSKEIAASMPGLNLNGPDVAAAKGRNVCDTDNTPLAPQPH